MSKDRFRIENTTPLIERIIQGGTDVTVTDTKTGNKGSGHSYKSDPAEAFREAKGKAFDSLERKQGPPR